MPSFSEFIGDYKFFFDWGKSILNWMLVSSTWFVVVVPIGNLSLHISHFLYVISGYLWLIRSLETSLFWRFEYWLGLTKHWVLPHVPTWIPREVTLPGLCPSGVGEHRALPRDVKSRSTTLEMKLGFESAPAYSYGFSESSGPWLGRQTMQETSLMCNVGGPHL